MKRKKNSASVGTQKSKVFFFFLGEEGSQSPMKMKKKKSTGNKSRQYDYTDIFWVPENSEMKKQQKIYT